MMLNSTVRKLKKSFQLRGVFGTAGFAAGSVVRLLRGGEQAGFRPDQAEDDQFDREHGVDTGGMVALSALEIDSSNWIHGICYGPTKTGMFEEMFDGIELRHEDYIFIDLGSGKGRALMLASHFPFKKVIGVEFSPDLHRVASENLLRYSSPHQRCKDITAVCADAITYRLPEENLVIYLYHPFEEPVMGPVVESLARSVKQTPRDVFVLYNNPLLGHLFAEAGFVKIKHRTDLNYAVFRTPPLS
ncbi:MAG: class I SAM-dependent methyltransferase [Verrucomicrobiae bacterium]|nr:class I SAM-dependent methyltransferase [Verrucomicrobiae bacterium]